MLCQLLERGRPLLQPPLGDDMALARPQCLQRCGKQRPPLAQFFGGSDRGLLAVSGIDQPILPSPSASDPGRTFRL